MAASWLLRQCLRDVGPRARFAIDTLVSPSVYLAMDRLVLGAPLEDPKHATDALDALLRPVLHPSARKPVDLHAVEGNIRFRAWVRAAYLTQRFGGSGRLREAEHRFADLQRAPTLAEADAVFGTADWDRHPKDRENALQAELVRQYEEGDPAVADWSLEQLLECVGCCVAGTSEFNLFCERNFVYELYTEEYVRALCEHIEDRAAAVHAATGRTDIVLLEVGAGNGQLARFLRERLRASRRSGARRRANKWEVRVVATDTGVWRAAHKARHKTKAAEEGVVQVDYREALKQFEPSIVLTSWMPMGQDWTAAFRATPSVAEYILIGEKDDGCCGHPLKTWGVPVNATNDPMFAHNRQKPQDAERSLDLFHWLSRATEEDRAAAAASDEPRTETGDEAAKLMPWEPAFHREDLAFSDLQLSRYDRAHYAANSHTVSFVRT